MAWRWPGGRRSLWAILAVLAVMAVGLWHLPNAGLHYAVIRGLQSLGWTQVSIHNGTVSLFKGAVVVHQVQAGDTIGKALGLDGLDLKFRWKPLFSRRVSIEHLDLTGLDVAVIQTNGHLEINGLPLSIAASSKEGEDRAWSYDVTTLTLRDSRLTWTYNGSTATIDVERLQLSDLKSWDSETPARLSLDGRLNGAPIQIQGSATPFAATPRIQMTARTERLDLAALHRLTGLDVGGRLSADLTLDGGMTDLTASGRITLDNSHLIHPDVTAQSDKLALTVQSAQWRATPPSLELSGQAEGRDLSILFGGVTLRHGSMQAQAKSLTWTGRQAKIHWDGELSSENSSLSAADTTLTHSRVHWAGQSRFDLAANAPSFAHGEGQLQVDGTHFTMSGLEHRTSDVAHDAFATTEVAAKQITDLRPAKDKTNRERHDADLKLGALEVSAARLTANGTFEHARPTGMLPPLLGHMQAVAEQVQIRQPGTDWLRLTRGELRDLRLAPTHASLAAADLRGVAALSQPGKAGFPWRFEGKKLLLERLTMDRDGGISLGSLNGDRATLRVLRGKSGIAGLPSSVGNDPSATTLPPVLISKIHLGNSRLEFEDKSLGSPVHLRLDGLDVTASRLDSQSPDQASPIAAQARLGNAALAIQGSVRPFQTRPGADLTVTVRDMELPPLSPYAMDALGVFLNTGQLDGKIAVQSNQGALNGNMDLTLDRLVMVQPGPDSKLAKQASMPIETVLDLLRDGDGRIHLSIPISGDLSQPDFDISDAVGQAIGGALKSTLFTTLKVAFPLLALIDLAIEEGGTQHLALDPLAFAPGSPNIDPAQHGKLGSVADLLTQGPSLKLTLCGFATTGGDWPSMAATRQEEESSLLDRMRRMIGLGQDKPPQAAPTPDMDALTALAAARADAAKKFLVDRRKIDAGRIFTCRPQVDDTPGKSPRVDLML